MDRLAGGKSHRPRGAAGAHSAHKAGAGAFGPRPCFGFAGPSGPQNAAAPRVAQRQPPPRSPAHLRRPYGGCPGEREGRGGLAGGGGVWRPRGGPQGRPSACQTKSAGRRQSLRAPRFSGRFASCRRSSQRSLRVAAKAASFNSLAHWASASLHPPLAALGSAPLPPDFPLTPKRKRKSQAFRPTRPRPVHHPEKGGSDREPLRGRLQPSRRAERGFFRRGAATE